MVNPVFVVFFLFFFHFLNQNGLRNDKNRLVEGVTFAIGREAEDRQQKNLISRVCISIKLLSNFACDSGRAPYLLSLDALPAAGTSKISVKCSLCLKPWDRERASTLFITDMLSTVLRRSEPSHSFECFRPNIEIIIDKIRAVKIFKWKEQKNVNK